MAGVTKPVPLPVGGGGPPLGTEASRAEQSRYEVSASVSPDSRGLTGFGQDQPAGRGSPPSFQTRGRDQPRTHGSQVRWGLVPPRRFSFVLWGHTYVLVNRWQLLNLPSALDCPATTQLLQSPGQDTFQACWERPCQENSAQDSRRTHGARAPVTSP